MVAIDLDKTEFVRGEIAMAAEHRAGTQTPIDDTPLGPDEEVIEEPCSCGGKDPACKWCVDGMIMTRRKKDIAADLPTPGAHPEQRAMEYAVKRRMEKEAEEEAVAQGDAPGSSSTVCMKCHGELHDGFPHQH